MLKYIGGLIVILLPIWLPFIGQYSFDECEYLVAMVFGFLPASGMYYYYGKNLYKIWREKRIPVAYSFYLTWAIYYLVIANIIAIKGDGDLQFMALSAGKVLAAAVVVFILELSGVIQRWLD